MEKWSHRLAQYRVFTNLQFVEGTIPVTSNEAKLNGIAVLRTSPASLDRVNNSIK